MKSITILNVVAMFFCLASVTAGANQDNPPPGLTVKDGVLCQAGKPYHGIGVNYFNLFYRTLKDPADKSYEKGLRQLSEAGIPFVRFLCGGFWPIDWELYLRDKETYFKLLDEVVRAAEKNHIGLIPSLSWNISVMPDIVGEPIDQFGNPDSKTIAFLKQYTREVVTRYQDSPAVWGWEFGNEYNLHADLPNAAQHRPPVWPTLKTALTRTERDDLKAAHMLTAFVEFAKTVRSLDPHRIIISGNSVPRYCAWHHVKEKNWKLDSLKQFEEILLRDNPDPIDTLCVHLYPRQGKEPYSAAAKNLTELIDRIQQISRRAKKPVFIGEFGAPATLGKEQERTAFEELIEAIVQYNVPLSALWVFDLSKQDKDWNVTFENDRAYMLELVAKANVRMQTKPASREGP